jgi:hypothetical protein
MPRMSIRLALVLAITLGVLSLGGARQVFAANQVVSDCGDSGGPNQLRAKIIAAQSGGGGTITFSCGPTVILTAGDLPTITTNITIDGGNTVTLSGNNASRLFLVSGGQLTLNYITLTKGNSGGDGFPTHDGGAIYNLAGTLNINNSKFLDNQATSAGNGGAILSLGVLNITNSEFAGNKAAASGGALLPSGVASVTTISGSWFHDNQALSGTYGGGAIVVSEGAVVTITSSSLTHNQALLGGAIYIYQISDLTRLDINNSSLEANTATDLGFGGGINNFGGTATLTNVTLSENHAGDSGGGIVNTGTASFTNVTLSGNSAASHGGGISNLGTATLTNVTLSANFASFAGGIYNNHNTATLTNTIVAKGAHGGNCYSALGGSFNYSDDGTCAFGPGGGLDSVSDLLLGALANNGGPTRTHMPQPPSPVIDGGTSIGCPATDQRGASRTGPFTGSACDAGAVEYGATLPWLYFPFVRR